MRQRTAAAAAAEAVERVASWSAVVVFSVSTSCMCHAVKRLFSGMGVSPTVVELDDDDEGEGDGAARGREMELVLPVVFIGGRLLGAVDRVMASHIDAGSLVHLLKDAGALWL